MVRNPGWLHDVRWLEQLGPGRPRILDIKLKATRNRSVSLMFVLFVRGENGGGGVLQGSLFGVVLPGNQK